MAEKWSLRDIGTEKWQAPFPPEDNLTWILWHVHWFLKDTANPFLRGAYNSTIGRGKDALEAAARSSVSVSKELVADEDFRWFARTMLLGSVVTAVAMNLLIGDSPDLSSITPTLMEKVVGETLAPHATLGLIAMGVLNLPVLIEVFLTGKECFRFHYNEARRRRMHWGY